MIYHITTDGKNRLCGAKDGEAIHILYNIRELDQGEWCHVCQYEAGRLREQQVQRDFNRVGPVERKKALQTMLELVKHIQSFGEADIFYDSKSYEVNYPNDPFTEDINDLFNTACDLRDLIEAELEKP